MKLKAVYSFFFLLTVLIFRVLLAGESTGDIEKGKVIEKIVCHHDSSQSYALHLPTAYANGKKWPVLFAFDPAARVTLPLKLFKTAAEKYNYIVVCPTNVKNGPRKPAVDAMRAVWEDVCHRFTVDKQRLYAAGFSGGSRVSTFFNMAVKNPVRGIIGCGAGLSQAIKPQQIAPTSYFGMVGFADFNYREMVELDQAFDRHGVTHRFIYFDANHRWPSESFCSRAIEWMELQAIKEGVAPQNQALADVIFKKELNAAREIEATGSIYFAVLAYEAVARDFKDTKPGAELDKIEQKITRLKETREFKKFQKEEQKRLQKEKDYIKTFAGTFAFLKQSNPRDVRLQKILVSLGIKLLEKDVKKKKNIYDAGLAERLLYNLGNQANREGTVFLKKGDYKRAVFFLEIAAASGKQTYFYSHVLYKLASAYAVQDKKKKALKLFKEAVENGFTYLTAIEANKSLDVLRNNPRFKRIIQQLKEKNKKE